MKEWFKYQLGYVNLDVNNLYLTNTGNWSETRNLEEKTKKVKTKNNRKSALIIGYISVVFLIFTILIYKHILNGKVSLTIIILIILGGHRLFSYLKTEIGATFFIPKTKILEIKIEDNSADILFTNGDGVFDRCLLYQIEEKGILLLKILKNQAS